MGATHARAVPHKQRKSQIIVEKNNYHCASWQQSVEKVICVRNLSSSFPFVSQQSPLYFKCSVWQWVFGVQTLEIPFSKVHFHRRQACICKLQRNIFNWQRCSFIVFKVLLDVFVLEVFKIQVAMQPSHNSNSHFKQFRPFHTISVTFNTYLFLVQSSIWWLFILQKQ